MSKSSAYFSMVKSMDKHDVQKVKKKLDTLTGVNSVSYSSHKQNVAVDFDDTGTDFIKIKKKIENLGYEIESSSMKNHIKNLDY